MARDEIVDTWKLASSSAFGLIDFEDIHDSPEWRAEEETRVAAFRKLPAFPSQVGDSLKTKMRFGIPCSHRRKIWFVASGGFDLLLKTGDSWDAVQQLASQTEPAPAAAFGVVPPVLDFIPETAAEQFREFLHVVWAQNRAIHFSPLIPVVSALLFLFMEPPLAYLSVQAMIIKSQDNQWYFPVTREQFFASAQGICQLVARHCPAIAKHSAAIHLSIAQIVLTIFPTFFLPFTTLPVTLTVFDSFVFEGRKVLTRLCIALMVQLKERLLRTDSPQDFLRLLIEAIEELDSVDRMKALLKSSFKLMLSRNRHIVPAETSSIQKRLGIMCQSESECWDDVGRLFSAGLGGRRSAALMPMRRGGGGEVSTTLANEVQQDMLPHVIGEGMLTRQWFMKLRENMPGRMLRFSAQLVYQMSVHGTLLASLTEKAIPRQPHIVIVQTESKKIGVFLSDPPALHSSRQLHYGSPATFVFDEEAVYRKLPPPNSMFMSVSRDGIIVGGPKPALHLMDGFEMAFSEECETFGSPQLLMDGRERILDVEMYGLRMSTDPSPSGPP
jgi:hypothetical protein